MKDAPGAAAGNPAVFLASVPVLRHKSGQFALPPPDPDWGGMINETRSMAMIFPWMAVFPCIAISSLVLGFNLLADGLREVSLRD